MSGLVTYRSSVAVLVFVLLTSALLPLSAQSPESAPAILVPPTPLGLPGIPCRNPFLCAAPDGTVAIVSEAGATGQRRLMLTELPGAALPQTLFLDFVTSGDCANPAAAYDSSGTLHVVWSEKRTGSFAIRHARRSLDRQWRDEGTISATPDVECEFPQVACDRSRRVWIAWQAGRSTRYSVFLAWRDAATSGVLDVTGPRGDHHNLYPQLFPDTPYPVVWYEEVGNSFQLRAAVVSTAAAQFDVVSPLEFDRLDSNQMPWLFQAPSGMLAGVWTDLVNNRVRVLVGLQSPSTRGEGLVADATDSGDAASPSAVGIGAQTLALAWTSRLNGGSAVYAGRLDGTSRVGPSVVLPTPGDTLPSRPRLAAGGGLVHCVWYSDQSRGGTGALYYAALRF